jgi:hypothetical protein
MGFWKDLFEIIQEIITSAGIMIAGIWTYLRFVRQRQGYPKLNIELSIDHTVLPEGSRLVHVEVSLLFSSGF